MTKEALKLALEALELHLTHHEHGCVYLDPAVTAIKEALAQPEQEPVAWKLVPVEPTKEMLKAMDECSKEGYDERLYAGHAASVYMAAVDVAPTPPQPWEKFCDSNCVWTDHHPDCKLAQPEKTVCPFCTSEWVTAEQHDRNVDRVERTPLTDKDIASIFKAQRLVYNTDGVPFARAIEAAHNIKGEA